MKRVQIFRNHLCVLRDCNKKIHKSLVHSADAELIKTICECVLNCLNGNVKLSDSDKHKLMKHKNCLRKLLSNKANSIEQKKKIIIQKGSGFLPIILSAVLSLLK